MNAPHLTPSGMIATALLRVHNRGRDAIERANVAFYMQTESPAAYQHHMAQLAKELTALDEAVKGLRALMAAQSEMATQTEAA